MSPLPPLSPSAPPAATIADQARTRAAEAKARLNALTTAQDRAAFWRSEFNPGHAILAALVLVGSIITPLPIAGAALGFRRAYSRILAPKGKRPSLYPLDPAGRYGLIVGALVFPFLLLLGLVVGLPVLRVVLWPLYAVFAGHENPPGRVAAVLSLNGFFSLVTVWLFTRWMAREEARAAQGDQHGSARFARRDELLKHTPEVHGGGGFLMGLGDALTYPKDGHFLTVAGTRGGKGTNLIIPNLLTDPLAASWVVVDPKGENAAVTGQAMHDRGKAVHVLNPWGLLPDALGQFPAATFNPLDLVTGDSPFLVDDVDLIAEMLVPYGSGGSEADHWNTRARNFIAGMLVHLLTAPQHATRRHLLTLWGWLRLPYPELEALAAEMAQNPEPAARATGDDLGSMLAKAETEFASIMSTARRYTDFLKSPALGPSLLRSSFDVSELTAGRTVVYVVIPAERLNTHAQWLRLVVTTCMRAVIRNPAQRVCFLLDEAAALGFISEVRTAMGIAAGYGLSVWNIFQNLGQLKTIYGDAWETILASSAVRQFFNVADAFTADYLSNYIGAKTFVKLATWSADVESTTRRNLLNPDEVVRATESHMLTFIDQEFPARVPKLPYYDVPAVAQLAQPNPYYGKRG